MKRSKAIYFFKITDKIDYDKLRFLLQLVSENKARLINAFRSDKDKKLSLYAQLAAKVIAKDKYNISLHDLEIITDTNGKPYFKNYPDIHFNISHSNSAVAIAFSDKAVGIDIECIMEQNMKIANRFFTNSEAKHIENSPDPSLEFTKIWTQKEAYIKALGEGLKMGLDSFCVLDKSLSNRFNTVTVENYIISYYDGEINNLAPILLTEEDIENAIIH